VVGLRRESARSPVRELGRHAQARSRKCGGGRQPTPPGRGPRTLQLGGDVLVQPGVAGRDAKHGDRDRPQDRRVASARCTACRSSGAAARYPTSGPTGDEGHPHADRKQPHRCAAAMDSDSSRRAARHTAPVARPARPRDQQEPLGIGREHREPAAKAVFDPPDSPGASGKPNPPASFRPASTRAATPYRSGLPRLSDHALPHPLIQRNRNTEPAARAHHHHPDPRQPAPEIPSALRVGSRVTTPARPTRQQPRATNPAPAPRPGQATARHQHTQKRLLLALRQQAQHASPTRNGPAPSPA